MNYKDHQNNIHVLDSEEHEHLLPAGSVPITDSEAAEIVASKVVPPTYSQRRAVAYPPIGDQLDALWKGGEAEAAMLKTILAVKAESPKP